MIEDDNQPEDDDPIEDVEIDDEEDDEEEEPDDDDLVTNDYVTFRSLATGHIEVDLDLSGDERWQDAVNAWMENEQFWPNVWVAEERGGYHRIDWEDES